MSRYNIALNKKGKEKKPLPVAHKMRKGRFPINDVDKVLLPKTENPDAVNEIIEAQRRYQDQQRQQTFSTNGAGEIISEGPTSRNLIISGPNGYRAALPIRHLSITSTDDLPSDTKNYRNFNDVKLTLTVSKNTAQALINDLAAAKKRYGYG